ncbi:MAG: (Fe-S)-binding protein [Candidatus Lokiarchaeota archaeon]|nr:(Fe-S)-binding protein [Candidatus Lokiarchaeota archaeon]
MLNDISLNDIIKSCYQCGKCTGFCPLSTVFEFSPRLIAKEFMGDSKTNTKIWDCFNCDACSNHCPMKINFSEFILNCRIKEFDEQKLRNIEVHSNYFSTLSKIMASDGIQPKRLINLPKDLQYCSEGEILFFRGCNSFFNLESHISRLGKDYEKIDVSVLKLLNIMDIKPVVLENECCCGHDSLWRGDFTTFKRLARKNIMNIRDSGAKIVIAYCAECYRTLKLDYERFFGPLDFQVINFLEFLEAKIKENPIMFRNFNPYTVTYHDPCRLGRHMNIYESPRNVLKSIDGLKLKEMENSRSEAICCGSNSWLNCNKHVKVIRKKRFEEAEATGAEILITSCPKCNIHFNCLKNEYDEEDKCKSKIMIKDLAVFFAESLNLI